MACIYPPEVAKKKMRRMFKNLEHDLVVQSPVQEDVPWRQFDGLVQALAHMMKTNISHFEGWAGGQLQQEVASFSKSNIYQGSLKRKSIDDGGMSRSRRKLSEDATGVCE